MSWEMARLPVEKFTLKKFCLAFLAAQSSHRTSGLAGQQKNRNGAMSGVTLKMLQARSDHSRAISWPKRPRNTELTYLSTDFILKTSPQFMRPFHMFVFQNAFGFCCLQQFDVVGDHQTYTTPIIVVNGFRSQLDIFEGVVYELSEPKRAAKIYTIPQDCNCNVQHDFVGVVRGLWGSMLVASCPMPCTSETHTWETDFLPLLVLTRRGRSTGKNQYW